MPTSSVAVTNSNIATSTNNITNINQNTVTVSNITLLSKVLYPYIVDVEVKTLQKFLNNNGYTIAKTGAGSKGNETTRMGPGTVAALKKFQNDNKIYPANGYNGIETRNKINSILSDEAKPASTTVPTVPVPLATTTSIVKLTKLLSLGKIDLEVKTLQKFLNNNGYTIAKTGAGSKGNETTRMGPGTVAALKKFQRDNSILANGYVGISTRTKINSLLK